MVHSTRSFYSGIFGRALSLGLTAQLALAPAAFSAATSTATGTAPKPSSQWNLPGQGGAQTGAGNANSTGQMLSNAMGVLSMGLGGLYMAKGAQQLSCCASGCTGAGAQSQVANQQTNNLSQQQASQITGTGGKPAGGVPVKLKLDLKSKFDGVNLECPKPRVEPRAASPLFTIISFFQAPQEAHASGCIDAMIALATGGLMLLQGLMGLNAANQAGNNANAAYGNASNMGSYPGVNGTSPTPGSENKTGNSGLGGTGRSGELVKIDPSLLRTGKANDIMSQFEQKFGLSRDNFANAVLNGEDPRKLFNSAPRNALSNADMNKATSAASAMSDAEKAAALNNTGLSDAQKELLARLNGAGSPENEIKVGGGASGGLARMTASKKDDELDDLAANPAAQMQLSPEVQAALAAKEQSDRAAGLTDMTIFQLVHAKYREKSKMIFGYDPDGMPKGVGDANGF